MLRTDPSERFWNVLRCNHLPSEMDERIKRRSKPLIKFSSSVALLTSDKNVILDLVRINTYEPEIIKSAGSLSSVNKSEQNFHSSRDCLLVQLA